MSLFSANTLIKQVPAVADLYTFGSVGQKLILVVAGGAKACIASQIGVVRIPLLRLHVLRG